MGDQTPLVTCICAPTCAVCSASGIETETTGKVAAAAKDEPLLAVESVNAARATPLPIETATHAARATMTRRLTGPGTPRRVPGADGAQW